MGIDGELSQRAGRVVCVCVGRRRGGIIPNVKRNTPILTQQLTLVNVGYTICFVFQKCYEGSSN